MTKLYQYGSIVAVCLMLLIGGYFYGHHQGTLAGIAQVNAIKASIATQTAAATKRAAQIQQQADADALARVKAAVSAANQATADRDADLQSANAAIARLKSQVSSYAKGSTESQWLATPIPSGIVGRMCLAADNTGAPNRNCAGGAIRADSGG